MTALKDYEVTAERFIAGQHRKVGEPVQMTERAAKYYVAPYGSGLKVAAPVGQKPLGKHPAKEVSEADPKG
ncbi:hypothetical protein [Sulfitobacter pontiacus]|uniref:hypothetical protein n=1 Tax=Sulfitobacter pontiacus TaxID=60137 RepID=UPI0021A2C1A3|nr:hypothetical protein [Sulfitobacter pontiacus]UWR20224.1 hypothetical protein K3755_07160 [Sulfitobacter pontiacus]